MLNVAPVVTSAHATAPIAISLADVIGIAGFILSLALAVMELFRHFAKVRIVRSELYPMFGDKPEKYVLLRAIAENHSSAPIGISGIDVAFPDCGNERLVAELGQRTVMSVSLRENALHPRIHSELRNTPLPINLNPHESREIVVVFHCRSSRLQEFLRLRLESSRPAAGSDDDFVAARFHLSTSRKGIDLDCIASVRDDRDLKNAIEENVQMG